MNDELAKQLRESVQQFYEHNGGAFGATRAFYWQEEAMIAEKMKPGMTLVDIGAGNGRFARLLPEGAVYIGIEPSSSLRAANLSGADLRAGSFPRLPLEDDCADIATSFAVIQHLPTPLERAEAVTELLRITKPGGCIAVTSWHPTPQFTKQPIEPLPGGEAGDVLIRWLAEGADEKRYIHDFSFKEWTELWSRPGLQIEQVGLFGRKDWVTDLAEGRNWFVIAHKI